MLNYFFIWTHALLAAKCSISKYQSIYFYQTYINLISQGAKIQNSNTFLSFDSFRGIDSYLFCNKLQNVSDSPPQPSSTSTLMVFSSAFICKQKQMFVFIWKCSRDGRDTKKFLKFPRIFLKIHFRPSKIAFHTSNLNDLHR